ncbi:MAG: glycosyltransferase [Candidatus Omnitrophota bacterium]|nr:MAG: glycosyltransferase [Candidatus Omnitrophota bacterium]
MAVLFIVNQSVNSTCGRRIRNFTKYFHNTIDYKILYRDNKNKIKSTFCFIYEIIKYKPKIVYVEQIAYSGCIAAILAKLFLRVKYIFCVSDAYAELIKTHHNMLIVFFAKIVEKWWLNSADFLLTCNPLHASLLKRKEKKYIVDYIEHGVDINAFKSSKEKNLCYQLGLKDCLVVGVVGSLKWSKRYRFCYGWDIVEALRYLKDLNIKALIIGSGSGSPHLKEVVKEYDLQEKVIFTGAVPYEQIAKYINCMDVCVSTQSNDLVGYVRCPTKLSEYMACGKYIISTNVGYATLYGDKVGTLLPYKDVKDNSYPRRLAEHIRHLYFNRGLLQKGQNGREIAEEKLDNRVLSKKLETILLDMINH